jgi:hypothetical protein
MLCGEQTGMAMRTLFVKRKCKAGILDQDARCCLGRIADT